MAKGLWLNVCFLSALLVCGQLSSASAQIFADSAPAQSENSGQASQFKFNNSWANPRRLPATQKQNALKNAEEANESADESKMSGQAKENAAQAAQQARKNAAEALSKSLAGKRGTSAPIRRVVRPGEKQTEDESLIFLFYQDFKISQTMGGLVMCDVRFIVMHTLENKINNLSFRLKWPRMETTLSYNDVEPNTETYFDYTLVGDGCYSMDKIPNVIVNRCRVKGLSQSACANKIRWLKKQ